MCSSLLKYDDRCKETSQCWNAHALLVELLSELWGWVSRPVRYKNYIDVYDTCQYDKSVNDTDECVTGTAQKNTSVLTGKTQSRCVFLLNSRKNNLAFKKIEHVERKMQYMQRISPLGAAYIDTKNATAIGMGVSQFSSHRSRHTHHTSTRTHT